MRLLTAVSLVRVQQGEPKETASFQTPFLFGSTRSGWTRRPVKKTMRCIVFRAREAYAAPGCAARSASRQRLKRRVQQGEPKRNGVLSDAVSFALRPFASGQRDCAAGASRLLTGRSRAPAVREAARRKPSEQRAQGRRSRRRSATIAN